MELLGSAPPDRLSEVKALGAWLVRLPLLGLAVAQARRLRRRLPALPEAYGVRSAVKGLLYAAAPRRPVLASPSRARSAAAQPLPEVPLRLVVLGESTAVGVGVDQLQDSIVGPLVSILGAQSGRPVAWSVRGSRGATLARLVEELMACPLRGGQVVVVLLGVSDVLRLTPVWLWQRRLGQLIELLASQGCERIVFSSLPPVGEYPALPWPLAELVGVRATQLDLALRRVVSGRPGVEYAAVEFPTAPLYLARDGVHPSRAGYARWARQLGSALRQVLGVSALAQSSVER